MKLSSIIYNVNVLAPVSEREVLPEVALLEMPA